MNCLHLHSHRYKINKEKFESWNLVMKFTMIWAFNESIVLFKIKKVAFWKNKMKVRYEINKLLDMMKRLSVKNFTCFEIIKIVC